MDITIVILKFAGLIVAGTLGMLGTIVDTHDEVTLPPIPGTHQPIKKKVLNRCGRWALCLTISGLTISLASQITEEVLKRNAQLSLIEETEKGVKTTNQILNGLRTQATGLERTLAMTARAATKFQDFSIDVFFDLPSDEAQELTALQTRIEELLESEFDGTDNYLSNGLSVQREFPSDGAPYAKYVVIPLGFKEPEAASAISEMLQSRLGVHLNVLASLPSAGLKGTHVQARSLSIEARDGERRLFFDVPKHKWLIEYRKMRVKTIGRPTIQPAIGWSDLMGKTLQFRLVPLEMDDASARQAIRSFGSREIVRIRIRLSPNLILEFPKSQIACPPDVPEQWCSVTIPDTEEQLVRNLRFEVLTSSRAN